MSCVDSTLILKQAVQGSGEITASGNVQKAQEGGAWGHGLVMNTLVPAYIMDLMILEIRGFFSQT